MNTRGLWCQSKPYYALYAYKIFNSDRFDLLGNSWAILNWYFFAGAEPKPGGMG